jgi:hypothetical protein
MTLGRRHRRDQGPSPPIPGQHGEFAIVPLHAMAGYGWATKQPTMGVESSIIPFYIRSYIHMYGLKFGHFGNPIELICRPIPDWPKADNLLD